MANIRGVSIITAYPAITAYLGITAYPASTAYLGITAYPAITAYPGVAVMRKVILACHIAANVACTDILANITQGPNPVQGALGYQFVFTHIVGSSTLSVSQSIVEMVSRVKKIIPCARLFFVRAALACARAKPIK
jgi:hypothetical protein